MFNFHLGKFYNISKFVFRSCSVASCYQYLHLKQCMNSHGYLKYSFHTCVMSRNVVNDLAVCDPDHKEFNNAYQVMRKALLHISDDALIDVVNWNAKVLDYNVQGGKQIRGITLLKAFKILSKELSPEKILEACLLGWCVELLQGFFLICDDIMDSSTTRRGKPCWYRKPTVGLMAINDGLLLEHNIYQILDMYFKDHVAYVKILHEFLQTTRKTIHGQCLDMMNVPPNKKPKFENFNLQKYKSIVEYKTSQYTFCLPVRAAMHLAGHFSKKEFELTGNICSKLGLLFQIQDDHLDTFGDPAITGKMGTDINDGKCTWFSASFFECAPEDMKKVMIENYGVDSKDCVSKVMNMYEELHLEQKFFKCEEELTNEINFMVENLPKENLKILFNSLLKKLHHRKK